MSLGDVSNEVAVACLAHCFAHHALQLEICTHHEGATVHAGSAELHGPFRDRDFPHAH